jgi:hypothetical protein
MATLAVPDLLRVQVDQERGGLTQVEFLQYFERDRETHVRLGSAAYPFLSLDLAPLTGNGNGEQEEVRSRVVNRDSRSLILERTLPAQGLSVTESWTLREDSYLADYSVLFEAVGEEGVDVPDFVVGAGAISLERLDLQGGGNKRMAGMTMQVSLMPEGARQSKTYVLGKVEKLGPADRAALRNTPVDWVAVHSKYFMFALVRDGNVMPGAMRHPQTAPWPFRSPTPVCVSNPGKADSLCSEASPDPRSMTDSWNSGADSRMSSTSTAS